MALTPPYWTSHEETVGCIWLKLVDSVVPIDFLGPYQSFENVPKAGHLPIQRFDASVLDANILAMFVPLHGRLGAPVVSPLDSRLNAAKGEVFRGLLRPDGSF